MMVCRGITTARTRRLALVFAAVSTLTACGGGGDPPAPPPSPTASLVAVRAPRLATVFAYSLAVRADGQVLMWGTRMEGATARTPIPGTTVSVLSNLNGVAGVVATEGGDGTTAIAADGSVRAWGHDVRGSFGDAPRDVWGVIDVPVLVPQFGTSVQTAPLNCQTQDQVWLSLRSDGTLWAVPGIAEPNGGTAPRLVSPTQVSGLPPISALSTGSCPAAIATDGRLYQLAPTRTMRETPTLAFVFTVVANQVMGLPPVSDASCNHFRCFAAAQDGTVWAWGDNSQGEFGDGTSTSRTEPIQVPGLTQIRRVISNWAGGTFAIDATGQLLSWCSLAAERAAIGRAFDATDPNFCMPQRVTTLPHPVRDLATAMAHTLVELSDGSVWAWGYGGYGALGGGTGGSSSEVPVRVPGVNLN